MRLDPNSFTYLIRVYNTFQRNGYSRDGFSSVYALVKCVENSSSPSTYGKVLLFKCLDKGLFFFDNRGVLLLNEDLFLDFLRSSELFKLYDSFFDELSLVKIPK